MTVQLHQQLLFRKRFDAFLDFYRDNFDVYCKFVSQALRMSNAGRRHYSARTIIENIRWETDLGDVASEFKINNDFIPYLARLSMSRFPELAGFFELRQSHYDVDDVTLRRACDSVDAKREGVLT